ncbi:MAG: phosphoribosylformylglycinamidine cyclo-ligase [Spirochaetaceae bacterium]|nr:phosphoribosylformylglycinamidine cyclo-ligase [Spirochaetaceae bacterium]
MSYAAAGVDIAAADAAKRDMARLLEPRDPRILNGVGPFATLIDATFPEYRHPVIVFKTEEPGSKQKLAVTHGAYRSLCFDLVNHLVNDIVVMGAAPVAVQDAIICGSLQPEAVAALVAGLAEACRAQECSLTGGETSEQPGVLEPGTYVLAASVVGVVEYTRVIDGSRIGAGDTVLALASNGVHTNGYSLVRRLLDADPSLAGRTLGRSSVLDALLVPHRCYLPALRPSLAGENLHGLAHVTGGGIAANLSRVLPPGTAAQIDLSRIVVPEIFAVLRAAGSLPDAEMLRVFNCGAGMLAVVAAGSDGEVRSAAAAAGVACYPVGRIVAADAAAPDRVAFRGALRWPAAR